MHWPEVVYDRQSQSKGRSNDERVETYQTTCIQLGIFKYAIYAHILEIIIKK